MSAPNTRTSTSFSCRTIRLTLGGCLQLHQRQQPVLEGEVRLRKLAIAVAQVPPPRLLQPLFEGRRTDTQDARCLAHLFGDGRHVEIFAEIGGISHGTASRMDDGVTWNAHQLKRLSGGAGQSLHGLRLSQRPGIAEIKSLSRGIGYFHGPHQGPHQIFHVDELHQPVAVAWDNDGPRAAHSIPEESLPIEWIARPIDEWWAESNHRQPVALMQTEQHPLRGGLV